MPRDLSAIAKEDTLQGMPELTKSPDQVSDAPDHEHTMTPGDEGKMFAALAQQESDKTSKLDQLHAYTQSLTISDIESCITVENEAFPENERCSREKFQYRLTHSSPLNLGIFTSHSTDSAEQIPTTSTSSPVYSGAPSRKSVLLGHIIATKTSNPVVTDSDMSIGSHDEAGRTLCIHSLAVLPAYQGRGLGKVLLAGYLQRMEGQGVVDRVALIARKDLVPFYERFGFECKGESKAQFGGGGWWDLVRELDVGEQGEGLVDTADAD